MKPKQNSDNLISFLKSYRGLVFTVILLALLINILTLALPRITAHNLDAIRDMTYSKDKYLMTFGGVATAIFIFGVIQTFVSNYTAERIAAELRRRVIDKVSKQTYSYINEVTTSTLLTNLTVDVDSVKNFISQGLVIAFASAVQLIGSAILLLIINWKLAIPIILTVPVLLISFGIIFKSINKYFELAKIAVDKLNLVINETIVGSALVRVLNSQRYEVKKFEITNAEAREIGIKIVNGFAALIPVITVVLNIGILIILGYGGIQVIDGSLSTGDFASFFAYLFTFIFPIIMLGFLGSSIGVAFAAYDRITRVINSKEPENLGKLTNSIKGNIEIKNVTLEFGNKTILDNISFDIEAGSRVAIIGPTASGKTQIFYLITGLINPTKGEIKIDGENVANFDTDKLYSQMGMVFQDNVIFNTSIRENIAFRSNISEQDVWKALKTAELDEFANGLPNKLDTTISERGMSLSGGQKQRLSLARALSINPKVLLLDDFTARVDINTEQNILENLGKNYPETTLIAITQKINSVKDFDQIILIMEGELIAIGKHEDLLEKSLEYQQIYNSQQQVS